MSTMRQFGRGKNLAFLAFFIILYTNNHKDECSANKLDTKEPKKIFVWYASYGSNMNMERFLCYIEGGKVEGMQKPCEGSEDKSRPTKTLWGSVPHRMFFDRNKTKTWGLGGVAFLDLERHDSYKAYIHLYKISLQQFNDVLKQENNAKHVMNHPLFGLAELARIKYQRYKHVGALKSGWYSTIKYLGMVEDLLVLTFTCPPWKLRDFRTGKLPICAPSKAYKDAIIKALVEEGSIPQEKAISYVRDSYEVPLSGLNSHNSSSC